MTPGSCDPPEEVVSDLQWIRKEETAREGCRENALTELDDEAKGYRGKHDTKLCKICLSFVY